MAGQCGSSLESFHAGLGDGTSLGCWVCAPGHPRALQALEAERFHIKPFAAQIEWGQRVAGAGTEEALGAAMPQETAAGAMCNFWF